jgi:alginate O-acetyltransferase complex protein AlgJ
MTKKTETSLYSLLFSSVFFILLLMPLQKFDLPLNSFDEGFYGRDKLLRLAANFRVLIGDQVYPRAVIGNDNWLVYTGELSADDYQNTIPFSEKELMRVQEALDTLNQKYAEQGITLLVVIAPNKNTIYPEYVPEEIAVLSNQSRLGQLMDYMSQYGKTEILDLRENLLDAKENDPVYYRTDTHWNAYGAYIAYQEVLDRLSFFHPELKAYPLSSFQQKEFFGQTRDLTEIMGTTLISEDVITLTHKPVNHVVEIVVPIQGSPRNLLFTSNVSETNLPSVVVFHDSFFVSVNPYLKEHFSNAVFIPHYTVVSDLGWVQDQKPDIVIIEYTERYIHSLIGLLATDQ